MNPHDPFKKPGAHLVFDQLGVEDPRALAAGHPPESPIIHLARMVATAARDVDLLHRDLTVRAQLVIERLEPIARGEHPDLRGVNGVIQSTGFQVELIAARRGAAYEQLTRAIHAYEQSVETGPVPGAPDQRMERGNAPVTTQQPLPADLVRTGTTSTFDLQVEALQALEAVDRGGLRICRDILYHFNYISDGSGKGSAIPAETVEALIADGLLAADTTVPEGRTGRPLSLTATGEAALEASRTASPKTSAALRPSTTGDAAPVKAGQSPADESLLLYAAARLDPEGFEREALRAVKRADLCLHTSPRGDKFIAYTDGGGATADLETVEDLIIDGLVTTDTSTPSSRPGQRLSLTLPGEAALEALETAHTADRRRMYAALFRSSAADPSTAPAPIAAQAAQPAPPSRTR